MATRVLLPKQGLQMVEGRIVRWLRKAGEPVAEGDDIVQIETDKATIDVQAPAAGVVLAILRQEGETVPVAETIAVIGAPGEDIAALAAFAAGSPAPAGARHFSSPRARTAAEQAGIDIRTLTGSGPDGLVIERDVTAAAAAVGKKAAPAVSSPAPPASPAPLASPPPAAPSPLSAPGRLVQPSRMRSTIARRMRESLETAAQAEMQVDVDCTEIVRLREGLKAGGVAVTYTDILVKIAGSALLVHPDVNSSWTPAGILERSEINVGVAVSVDGGLLVPVIRAVDRLSIGAIGTACRELAAKARAGKLDPMDMEGAGFTVSNLGMQGIDRFTAIINQPESAILAAGRIVDRPVAVKGTVQVRPVMTLTLSYDHRLIDGAPAAAFLASVRDLAENPYLLAG